MDLYETLLFQCPPPIRPSSSLLDRRPSTVTMSVPMVKHLIPYLIVFSTLTQKFQYVGYLVVFPSNLPPSLSHFQWLSMPRGASASFFLICTIIINLISQCPSFRVVPIRLHTCMCTRKALRCDPVRLGFVI